MVEARIKHHQFRLLSHFILKRQWSKHIYRKWKLRYWRPLCAHSDRGCTVENMGDQKLNIWVLNSNPFNSICVHHWSNMIIGLINERNCLVRSVAMNVRSKAKSSHLILAFQRLDQMNNWFDLTITIFRSNTNTLVDINQIFFMINQKIRRHTDNFWGSGSYSKSVRPNGFLIYRRAWHQVGNNFQERTTYSLILCLQRIDYSGINHRWDRQTHYSRYYEGKKHEDHS
jgi:hypothetical protein